MDSDAHGTGRGTDWDAVVVGAGLGGLTAAAYLAASGKRVLVLEQFSIVGGNSHVFRRRRSYEFDVGVHYLGDCAPGGVIPSILSGVGLGDRVDFLEMDQDGFDLIRVPGVSVDMPAGWEAYRRRLTAAMPGETDGLNTFVDICSALGEEQRAALFEAHAWAPQDIAARTAIIRQWGRRTLDDLFRHCGLSPRARTVLAAQAPNYGLTPKQATVARHTSVTDHYLRGAYYPAGGGQVLAAGLVEVIEAHGGQVRTRSRVSRILVEDRQVVGVHLEGGEVVTADLVVSNADYPRTVLELVGAEHFQKSVVTRTERATMGMPWLVLYLGLDTDLRERPNANLWWYDTDDIDGYFDRVSGGETGEVPFLFCSFASLKDPGNRELCPPGHANLQVMTLCPPDYAWWGVDEGPAGGGDYRRNPTYLRRKQELTEATLDAAEKALGPLRPHITHLEAATPLTHERYTLSTGGTPFGMAEWGGTARPGTATAVKGLHVVGASTQAGNGIAGVMLGGVSCAADILGEPLLAAARAGTVYGDPDLLPERPEGWDPRDVCRGGARRTTPPRPFRLPHARLAGARE
ncbi:phytoene desaturase family protein [Streptomyces griseoloalbus]|uniref:All-trans-retinol 13,14-reductase n=1 Tax=Streptomyces griseoloalbus TaxID=67303 RepID=A0A7W8FA48_9ACTN|nr:NAD(P)/FAD-dependent oxidoreductase [Streptomyces albaduncus]MBB5128868.1 all-trans-retinol 13,14-reductase [Streptomyces albaduncus]GGW43255.1 phytoene dehydrogenase [Streptomyces albaduncus]